jgi:hypothetical protein
MPLNKSDFKEKALKKAVKCFEDVCMTEDQIKIFNDLVQIINQFIPLGEPIIKGMGWKAISLWQKDYNINFVEITIMRHEDRMKAIKNIMDYVKIELIKDLINSEYQTEVDNAVNELLANYDEKYAQI